MNLSEFIAEKEIVILDGGMGTQLEARGAAMGGRANLSNPDAVLEIHEKYLKSGSHIITANTFAMNRLYIEGHNLNLDVHEVNRAGVELARKAAGPEGFVLGDMSSVGRLLKPYGPVLESDAFDTFCEHASILKEAGADGLIVETMTDLKEAVLAVKACRQVTDLPVIASMAFSTNARGGKTVMGNGAADCASGLTEAGADVIGTNCGDIDPFQMAEIISLIVESTNHPVLAMPNAGHPRFIERKAVFEMPPSEYLKGVKECVKAGAKVIGGCCGTSPEFIKLLAEEFGK